MCECECARGGRGDNAAAMQWWWNVCDNEGGGAMTGTVTGFVNVEVFTTMRRMREERGIRFPISKTEEKREAQTRRYRYRHTRRRTDYVCVVGN